VLIEGLTTLALVCLDRRWVRNLFTSASERQQESRGDYSMDCVTALDFEGNSLRL
jgi:hypothetical protein